MSRDHKSTLLGYLMEAREHLVCVERLHDSDSGYLAEGAAVELLATCGRLLGAATEWRVAQDDDEGDAA